METLAILANSVTLLVIFLYMRWALTDLRQSILDIEKEIKRSKIELDKLKPILDNKAKQGKQLLKG